MTDDTRSDDFPAIVSNPKNRDEVWCGWMSYSGRQDEFRLARYNAASKSWGAWNCVPESNGASGARDWPSMDRAGCGPSGRCR